MKDRRRSLLLIMDEEIKMVSLTKSSGFRVGALKVSGFQVKALKVSGFQVKSWKVSGFQAQTTDWPLAPGGVLF